ncbi:PD-(D/E)XK nuclease family protein [Ruminococcus sp. FC2018]|uniref:PD-(D/E)XK nuclease family protein n=1 Tax=Ruminococcus sp. FC2018 TaxID=1410617 RepID=UPI00048AACD9|nr:PD-(D/E)XK nuclease family protein [Ruminococcus sp. FC2018]
MIRFFIGGATSDREERFIDSIKSSVSDGKNVVVMIPDQFSFEYDKKLYNKLGAVDFNRITTAGFNRISELLLNKYGGNIGQTVAGENAKIILMYKAIQALRSRNELKYYVRNMDKKGLEKGNFISQLIDLVQQMRESGITYELLSIISDNAKGSFSLKIHDIALIYNEYMQQLSASGLHDAVSSISAAVSAARDNLYFACTDIYIDSFSSFSYDELKMIELCFSQADNVNISLCIDNDSCKNAIHPFKITERTLGTLRILAGSRQSETVYAVEMGLYSTDIAYVSKNLFNITKTALKDNGENVRIISADDVYSEAMFVCAQIKHLVSKGYRYSDIAVIVRNVQEISGVFESTMERYEIPYFIDLSEKISASSIIQYFTSLFNCLISGKYKTEKIIKLVKSPFYSANKHNANIIERYCLKWNINGDMWTKVYFGLDTSLVKSETELKHINSVEELRKSIISPLEKFRKVCGKGDLPASEICQRFFALLDELNVSKRVYSVVKNAVLNENQTQTELSRGLRQLWNSILSGIKSIYDCLGEESISLRQFYELFRVMVSQMSVSNPPQKIDCVRIADSSHSRLTNVKIAFVCQVNDGVFPKVISNNSLLSRTDMSVLQKSLESFSGEFRRDFSGDVRYSIMNEELSCYNAVSMASEKLFVSYINADLTGEEKRPSVLVNDILKCFKNKQAEKLTDIPLEFFCTSEKTAYHIAIEHFNQKSSFETSVKASLKNTEYGPKLYAMENAAGDRLNSAKTQPDSELSHQTFFNNNMAEVSASQVDSYYKCPFSYFCRYGLRLRPIEIMEMSPDHKGTLVHLVLQKVFSDTDKEGQYIVMDDSEQTDDRVKYLIDECFDDYYNNSLNSDFGKTETYKYDYDLLKNITFRIVKYVQQEFNRSRYNFVETEYDFGIKDNSRIVEYSTAKGNTLKLKGFIDRVDLSDPGGSELVRIIDYKTGSIAIDYSHLQCGLNLQMLIYLDAYMQINGSGSDIKPAGIEYMTFGESIKPIRDSSITESMYSSEHNDRILKAFKPKGIIVGNSDVIGTFNKDNTDANYMYAPFDKNKKDTVDEQTFNAIRKYAGSKVIEFGNALEKGDFPMRATGNVCSCCDYRTICNKDRFEDNSGLTTNKKELEDKFKETIAELSGSENGGDK